MRIRTRMAGAIAGSAFAGLAALAVGAAAPAGAQQLRPAAQTVSAAPAPAHAVVAPQCWDDDCGWGDGGWDDDDWGGGWDSWYGGWGW
jgi:hypothetical protein